MKGQKEEAKAKAVVAAEVARGKGEDRHVREHVIDFCTLFYCCMSSDCLYKVDCRAHGTTTWNHSNHSSTALVWSSAKQSSNGIAHTLYIFLPCLILQLFDVIVVL